jgi:hypothetical protein
MTREDVLSSAQKRFIEKVKEAGDKGCPCYRSEKRTAEVLERKGLIEKTNAGFNERFHLKK